MPDARERGGRLAEIAAVALVFGAFLLGAFAPVTLGDRTFAPNGRLATQSGVPRVDYPYEAAHRAAVNDAGALAWFFEPTARTVHRAYADGVLPLWNPYAGLGMPLAANFQSAPAGPFAVPIHLRPTQDTWDLAILLRLLVGGVGCFALLRALGAGRAPAFVAATGYLLSSNFVLWLFSVALSVEALVPWLLLAILGLVRKPGAARFAAVAVLTAATALGGQPESLVLAAYVAGSWGLYWWLREGRSVRVLAELVGAAAVGGLLAAPLLLLSAEYVSLADDSHGGTLGQARLELDLVPKALLGDFADRRLAAVGIGLLALAAAGLAGRRRAGVAGGGVLLALTGVWAVRTLGLPGENVVGLLPGIDAVNIRRYGFFLAVLTASVLAAAGIQAIVRGSRPALVAGAVTGAGVPLLGWPAGAGADARPALVIALVLAAGLVAVLLRPRLAPLLALVLVAQFVLLTPRVWVQEHDPFVPRPFVSYLQANVAPGERVSALGWILRPQYPSAFGLPDPRALDALFPRRYARYMHVLVGGREEAIGSPRVLGAADPRSPFFAALGVRYLVTGGSRRGLRPAYEPVFRDSSSGRRLTVWRSRVALPRGWTPERILAAGDAERAEALLAAEPSPDLARVSVVEDPTPAMLAADGTASVAVEAVHWDELRLRVEANGPSVVVVSDQIYPGWEARVDGEPTEIRPANLAMRAVAVPAGEHELVFRYRPRAFTVGLALALAGLAALLARWIVPATRRRYQLRGVASAPSSTSGGGEPSSRDAR